MLVICICGCEVWLVVEMRGHQGTAKLTAEKRGQKGKMKDFSSPRPSGTVGVIPAGKSEPCPKCCECGIVVSDDVSALQCDRCGGRETWVCADCLGLSSAGYNALFGCKRLKFFCTKCEETVLRLVGEADTVGSADAPGMVERVMDQLGSLERKLASRIDEIGAVRIEDSLRKMEERLMKIEKDSREREEQGGLNVDGLLKGMKMLEERVMKVEEGKVGKGPRNIEDGRVRGDELDLDEIEDRVRRSNCVIIHGVAESGAEEALRRREDDRTQIEELFSELGCGEARAEQVIRLGKRMSGVGVVPQPKPRPIKLVLDSERTKVEILRSAKNLRMKKDGMWRNVFIHQDLTPRERQKRKELMRGRGVQKAGGERELATPGRAESRAGQQCGQLNLSSSI